MAAEIFSLSYLAMVAEKFTSISATDCNLKSCKNIGKVHTMCKYTVSKEFFLSIKKSIICEYTNINFI